MPYSGQRWRLSRIDSAPRCDLQWAIRTVSAREKLTPVVVAAMMRGEPPLGLPSQDHHGSTAARSNTIRTDLALPGSSTRNRGHADSHSTDGTRRTGAGGRDP